MPSGDHPATAMSTRLVTMSQLASRVKRVQQQNETDQPDRHQEVRRQREKAENF